MRKFIAIVIVLLSGVLTWVMLDTFVGKRPVQLPPMEAPDQPEEPAPEPEPEEPTPEEEWGPPEIDIPRLEEPDCEKCPNGICPVPAAIVLPELKPLEPNLGWTPVQPPLVPRPKPRIAPEVRIPQPRAPDGAEVWPRSPPIILKEVPSPEPKWAIYKPAKNVSPQSIGKLLADIENHMDYRKAASLGIPNGTYRSSDKINWAHETTHGINGILRNLVPGGNNCFYCLENRVAVIKEPPMRLSTGKRYLPRSLYGFAMYSFTQQGWSGQPLYVFDEWISYTNGCAVRVELDGDPKLHRDRSIGGAIDGMASTTMYALAQTMAVKANCKNYDDKQLKAFVMWNTERAMKILAQAYKQSPGEGRTGYARVFALRKNSDCAQMRLFCKAYFGESWCKRVLGI